MDIDKIALEVAIHYHINSRGYTPSKEILASLNFAEDGYDTQKGIWDSEENMEKYHKEHPKSKRSKRVMSGKGKKKNKNKKPVKEPRVNNKMKDAIKKDIAEDRQKIVIDALEDIPDKKTRQLTLNFAMKDTINIEDKKDILKVEQASNLLTKNKKDPKGYNSPKEIIDKYAKDAWDGKRKADPEDYDEFTDKKELDHGVTTFKVQDDKKGQKSTRDMVDSHFGVGANPWCLIKRELWNMLAGDTDDMLDGYAQKTWKQHNKTDKNIVFQDGKLNSFYADGEYWDKDNNHYKGIPIVDKMKDDKQGRKEVREMNPDTGELGKVISRFKGSNKDGEYKEWDIETDELTKIQNLKGGKLHGKQLEINEYEKIESNYLNGKKFGIEIFTEIDPYDDDDDGYEEKIEYKNDMPLNENGDMIDQDYNIHFGDFDENGLKQGEHSWYDKAGGMLGTGNWIDDKKDGIHKEYGEEYGEMIKSGNWIDGKKDGLHEEYDEDDNIISYGNWINGKEDGEHTNLDKNGNEVVTNWKNGKKIK